MMDIDVCASCDKLEEQNFEFVNEGLTDDMVYSLKANAGIKKSLGHKNCEDLNDLNDCLIGGMVERTADFDVCDINALLNNFMVNLYNVMKALISSDCGQWEQIEALWDEINEIWDAIHALQNRVTALENAQNGLDALEKLLTDLKNSGAWTQTGTTIYQGKLNTGRHLATGNINLFGGTLDGNYFIRTNSGKTENDLAGGV